MNAARELARARPPAASAVWSAVYAAVRRALRTASWPVVHALVLLIRAYQLLISPALRAGCRFEPSCSCYAIQSLNQDGLIKGVIKTTWRLCRCQPLSKGGYDPP